MSDDKQTTQGEQAAKADKPVRRPTRRGFPWRRDQVREEMSHYESRAEFRSARLGAYRAAKRMGFYSYGLRPPKPPRPYRPTKWTFERLCWETVKYWTQAEFRRANRPAYEAARRQDLLDHIPYRGFHEDQLERRRKEAEESGLHYYSVSPVYW